MRMKRNAKPGCRRTVSWASATLCGNPPPWPSPTASPASTYLSNLPFFPTIFSSLCRLRLTSLLLLNLSLSRQPSCPRPPLVFRHHQTSPLIVMMDRPVAIATTSSFYSSSTMLNKNTLEGFPIPPHPPVGQESPQTVPPLLTVLIEQGEVPTDTIDARGGKSKDKRPLAGIISCPVSNSFRE